jgi:hypothetical protein
MREFGMLSDLARPSAEYSIYPPYHFGEYLEEYFYTHYCGESNKKYIDCFWTNLYCNRDYLGTHFDVQSELNKLNHNDEYFTVVQHDLGVKEKLPKNTTIFSAGGLQKGDNIIPIPLICSQIPSRYIKKEPKQILASFVGSLTHPIRMKMYDSLKTYDDCAIYMKNWMNVVAEDQFKMFVNASLASKFVLCPRGFGTTSFRLYEAFQLNSVPVYISDEHYLPWSNELNWNEFCVLINKDQIENIHEILNKISDKEYEKMLMKGQEVYSKYFTLDGMVKNIIKRI